MTTAICIVLQSVSSAPLISKNDTQYTNLTKDEGAEKNESSLLIDGLFEGDLAITEEFIRQHYNFSSIPKVEEYMSHEDEGDVATESTEGGQRINKRAAKRNLLLWTNGIVPYKFSSSSIQTYGLGGRHSIREAMDHWEDRTCLRFTLQNSENDYVVYNNAERTCTSSSVGRKGGGKQTINMDSVHGCGIGTIVHEIGHAIGFWHEQSRPDRDNYIRINLNNVENDRQKHNQFNKRDASEVDSQGSEYDYGSCSDALPANKICKMLWLANNEHH